LKNELPTDRRNYVIHLSMDSGAPRDYGTGFTVSRRKISEQESVPPVFQFWYTVIDGKLDHGWECRDPNNTISAKQLAMFERQKRVKDLLASGMQQKDIASAIGVNAATVSRDVGAIKVQEQEKKPVASMPARFAPEDDDEDDEDEGNPSARAAIAAKVKADKEVRVKAQAERADKDDDGAPWDWL
jgi:hypothetical protein